MPWTRQICIGGLIVVAAGCQARTPSSRIESRSVTVVEPVQVATEISAPPVRLAAARVAPQPVEPPAAAALASKSPVPAVVAAPVPVPPPMRLQHRPLRRDMYSVHRRPGCDRGRPRMNLAVGLLLVGSSVVGIRRLCRSPAMPVQEAKAGPACPNCGSTRVERFCAGCGARVTDAVRS